MKQDFSGVMPSQLAVLFPIVLEPYNSAWPAAYARELTSLRERLGQAAVRVSHIGSTAVPGLMAKPTIDILLEVARDIDLPALERRMLEDGYVINRPPQDLVMFLKGYTPRGLEGQAYHIHVRYPGDWDEPYFRDYLAAHPPEAEAYAALKQALTAEHTHDRDAYTAAKGTLVREYTDRARGEFPGKYRP